MESNPWRGGGVAGINKQVTPGALQRLELPQRGSIVSGIASAVSLTFKKKREKREPAPPTPHLPLKKQSGGIKATHSLKGGVIHPLATPPRFDSLFSPE